MAKKKAVKNAPRKRAIKKKKAPPAAPVVTKEMRHYAEILQLNDEVRRSYNAWEVAKHEAKSLKEVYEVKCAALTTLINEGPDPQLPLNFGDDDQPGGRSSKTIKPPAAWMVRPVGVLGLPKGIVSKLEEGGIETLGQLEEFWKQGRLLSDLKGIGDEKAAEVAGKFAEYAKDHPEVYGLDDAPALDADAADPPEGDDED